MATSVSICNAALMYLGHEGKITRINPPDNTAYSETCATYYPMALRSLLEAHDWTFCTLRTKMARWAGFDSEVYQWKYGFILPNNCLRIVGVYLVGQRENEDSIVYEVESLPNNEGLLLLTNEKDIVLHYVTTHNDADKYPQYFVNALVLQLATLLCGPLMQNAVADKFAQEAARMLEHAKYLDSRFSSKFKHEFVASHLLARSI